MQVGVLYTSTDTALTNCRVEAASTSIGRLFGWGDLTTGRMGRIPTAIQCALQHEATMVIWSTGVPGLAPGEFECEHAFRVALERYERLKNDFPQQLTDLLPASRREFEHWLDHTSVFDKISKNTATSMVAAVPFIDKALNGLPGTVFTVTSANHAPRTLRDAISVWKEGILIEGFEVDPDQPGQSHVKKRPTSTLTRPNLVTIAAVAAGTDYGGKDVSYTRVDDLGEFLLPVA